MKTLIILFILVDNYFINSSFFKRLFLSWLIIFITLICGSETVYGQDQKTIDSLKQVINTAKHDTTLINAYGKWGEEIYMQLPDSAIILWKISETIANKNILVFENLKGMSNAEKFILTAIKRQIAPIINNIGFIYDNQGDITKALEYYNKSHKILEEIGDKKGVAYSFCNIGVIYNNQGDIHKALEYYNKSLKIREEISDKKGMAESFNNIGFIYYNQSDIPKALEYFNKSLKIQEEVGDKKGIATSFNNIGFIYYYNGDLLNALEYYNKSLKIQEEIGDKQGMAKSFNNIGSINKDQGDLPNALEYYNKSLKIKEEIGDKHGMAYSLYNIGKIFLDNNDIQNAKNKFEQSYKLSKEIGYPDNIESAASGLKKVYLKQGNYKLAYEFYKEEILMHDSIQNKENYKKTQKQQAKYEYEKKATTDSISNAKAMEIKNIELSRSEEIKKKQLVVIYSFIIGFIIIIFFSIIIFRLFIQKKLANVLLSQQKEEISAQRDEIETQRDLVTVQKEHIEEIHKEVTDSINYAERIQRSFLATKELLDENLNSSLRGMKQSLPSSSSLRGTKQSIEDETNYFVFFHPKDVVSGDFYWAGKLQNGNFALATADSTGHGVPGAIMSILNISSLEKAVESGICEPSEILNHTRKTIIERLKKDGSPEGGKDGMDASLISFDFANLKLTYSAANNAIWIVRSSKNLTGFENLSGLEDENCQVKTSRLVGTGSDRGSVGLGEDASANHEQQTTNHELFELLPDKMPIGKHDKDQISFTQHTFQLQKGDVIYTLTDGFPDQFGGPKGKKFMSKKLKELIIANCLLTMEEQKEILEKTLVEWIGEGEQIDDITIIGIRI